jgi:hypothetical protein
MIMREKPFRQGFLFLALLLLAAGCEEENGGQDADADVAEQADLHDAADVAEEKEDIEAETQEVVDSVETPDAEDAQEEEEIPPPPPHLALTTNTSYDFSSGSYSVIRLDDMSVSRDVMSIHSDAVARCLEGMLFILERYGADTVTIPGVEPPYSIQAQYSVEAGSNPVDLDLLPDGRGVVPRNNVTTAGVIDLTDGALDTTSLDLALFADADGIPEAGAVAVKDGKIFVALQLLDRGTAWWDPTGPGLVAVFDAGTLGLIDVDPVTDVTDGIALTGANPQPTFQEAPYDDGLLLVAEAGFYGSLDGGIEGIDAATYDKTGFIVTEETLGGDITAWVVADADTGYALVMKPGYVGDKLVRFDPSDGTLTTDPVAEGGSYTMTGMALTGDGRLLVVDRALDGAGVLVFDVETGDRMTDTPISTGVPPFSICVL